MRLLFYGLQNSGATLLTLLAGQRPGSVVLPDLWSMYCSPAVETDLDTCVKATITSTFPLDEHVAAYRPDHVFLVVRRPVDNLVSLRRKLYARHNGTVEQKFAVADDCFAHPERFTDVLLFESVVADPSPFVARLKELGWQLPDDATSFPRSSLEMERHIWSQLPVLYGRVQWGAGEARIEPLGSLRLGRSEDAEAAAFAAVHAPTLHHFYEERASHEATEVTVRHTAQDEAALQNRANHVRSLLGIFEGMLKDGRGPAALELATELTELAPHSCEAWIARARALEHCGSIDLATEAWDSAERHFEDDPVAMAQLGVARARQALRLGSAKSALELTSQLVTRYEGQLPAHLLHAELSLRSGDVTTAREHAQRVLAAQPRNVSAGLVLADVLEAQGRREAGIRVLKMCLAIQPDLESARRRLAELVTDEDPSQSARDLS